MGIFCRTCQESVDGDIAVYRRHLKDRKHLPPFLCFEGACNGTTFALAPSLLRHIQQKHGDVPAGHSASSSVDQYDNVRIECTHSKDDGPSDVDMPSAPVTDSDSNSDDDDNEGSEKLTDLNKVFERAIAQLCMNLWRKGNVPAVAIELVVGETEKLILDVTNAVKQEIENNLLKCAVSEDIISTAVRSVTVQSPGANLKTKQTQMQYFEKHFGLIKPVPKFIRHRYDQRLDPTSVFQQDTQVSSSYLSISIVKTLTAILNDPVLYRLIHDESPSLDGHIRSFLDGTLAEKHALIRKYPHTLRLVLNGDEVELVNKLGTKTFFHKLMGIYYLLQNLPPEENARLRSIHVAAYGYSADFDQEVDVDSILGEICRELEMLQSDEGVLISVNDRPYPLHAVVIAIAADTEGAHKLLGLLPPSASCFCRWCTVQRKEMHQNIFAMGEERTPQLHEQHIEEVVTRGQPARTSTGVKRDSILRPVLSKFSEFPQLGVFDSMHDILKGVAAMEMKLALHEFCIHRKFISSETLNARIKSFPFGPQDVKNKPSANFTDKSLSNQGYYALSQTAAQTWCLLRVFVFLVSPDVPHDNSHLKLVSLMKRISEVIFSGDITQENIVQLENLIHEHHRLFFELYPPSHQENNPDQDQDGNEDGENDWNENFVDDPEEPNPTQEDNVNEEENSGEPSNKRTKKKKKIIRPINKHHQILHYPSMLKRYGPAQNYWCMRFEAKHKIASQYATTSGNFINVASSVADVHQISHAADLKEIVRPVREELQTSRKFVKVTVSSHPYCQQLVDLGLDTSCVVSLPKHAIMGGFYYKAGLYVVMPTRENDLPVFGLIEEVVVWENSVILMVQEQETLNYNELFGAYVCRPKINNEETRASFTSSLPSMQSLSAWPRPNVPDNGIAGRHLHYLKNGQIDLKVFKINLGDVLDIERDLESYEESLASAGESQREIESGNQFPSRSPTTNCAITMLSLASTANVQDNSGHAAQDDADSVFSQGTLSIPEADGLDLDLNNTLQEDLNSSGDGCGGNRTLLNSNNSNPNSNILACGSQTLSNNFNVDNENNNLRISTDESTTSTSDEHIDLTEYVPAETLNELSEYEKQSIVNKIKLYHHCKSQGLHFKLVLPGIPIVASQKPTQKPSTSRPLADVTNSGRDLRRSARQKATVCGTAHSSSDSDQSNSPMRKKQSRCSDSNSSKQVTNSSSRRQTTNDSSRVTVIPDYLSSFLEAPNLNEDEKSLIKDFIGDESVPNYDVRNILKSKRGLERALHQLNTKGSVFGTDLKDVIDELVTHLFSQIRKGLNIPAEMKVGMAVSFVATFPKMCQALVSPNDKPWTWLFSREENCGKLANCVTAKQRQPSHPKPRGGGLERRKNPTKKVEVQRQALTVQQLNLSNDVKYLRVLLDTDRTRDTIETFAKKTFEERRALIKKQNVPLKVLLEAFPFITFFKGAMIDFEFDLIHPGKGEGFLRNFHLLVPKLLKVAELDEKKYPPQVFRSFSEDDLNACLILSKFLPKPKKTYSYEDTMNPCPDISDFFHVVPVGSNIQHEISRRCIERNHPVQPYLLCLGHPRCLGKITLVWGDKESTDLPIGTAPLKAIDYLTKAFHVMQVPYHLGWKNFFRFISYHFYQVDPDNKRLSVFTAQFIELNAIEI